MTEIQGMVKLLRSIAERLENSADGLSRDFLLEVADRMVALEDVAAIAGQVVSAVPTKSDGAHKSYVSREEITRLIVALNYAGKYGNDGTYIEPRLIRPEWRQRTEPRR